MVPILAKHLKADYVRWVLVQLPSGRWASVWHECIENEALCESILQEAPEHFETSRYPTQADALKAIVDELEREAASNPLVAEFFAPEIQRARADLDKLQPPADVTNDDTARLDFLCQHPHLRIKQSGDEWVVWNCREGLEMVGLGQTYREALDMAREGMAVAAAPEMASPSP